jgi:hypothetical protein
MLELLRSQRFGPFRELSCLWPRLLEILVLRDIMCEVELRVGSQPA